MWILYLVLCWLYAWERYVSEITKIRKKQHIAIYLHLLYAGKVFLGTGSHILSDF